MTGVRILSVTGEEAGMRLDRWFRTHFPDIPQARLQKLLRTGQVRIDGARARANARLESGQAVRIPPLSSARPRSDAEQPIAPEDYAFMRSLVLYKDDNVLALNKPAGLAVQGGSGTKRHLDGLLAALQFKASEKPRLVHRLDRDTSGVLVLARTRQAATALGRAFKARSVEKTYWALVAGVPRPVAGTIDLPLVKSGKPGRERVHPVDENDVGGQAAITDYALVAEAGQSLSWLVLSPRTGRTHQLRAHLAAIGHPVIGDYKYGGEQALPGGILAAGLHLHARALVLPLPGGKSLALEAGLPDHMAANFETLAFEAGQAEELILPWREAAP